MKSNLLNATSLAAISCALLAAASGQAFADDQPAAPPAAWADTIAWSGSIEVGASVNDNDPHDGINFGQAFTDRADSVYLNQLLLEVERDLDPKNPNFDVGFKLQGMYGSDARYTHFLGELDKALKDREQFDIVEADLSFFLPILSDDGVNLKVGQYPTPLGYEVIGAAGNPLYSHSYIFQWGLPYKHTGAYATWHVNDTVDVYLGADTGVNTSIGKPGDDNDSEAMLGGVGLNNLLDGKLTLLALAHIGAENPRTVPEHNNTVRQFYDGIATYKISDALTWTTEFNYVRDDFFHATAEGIATYLSYTFNDQITFQGRAEVFRDDDGFFVAAFPNSLDPVKAELGQSNTSFNFGKETYTEFTFGVNYKPPGLPDIFSGTVIRPEVRYDFASGGNNGSKPFGSPVTLSNGQFSGDKSDQFTAAVDLVVPF